MLSQVEVTTVDFAKKFTKKALEFAEMYIHKTDHEYTLLRRNCAEYEDMKDLLSTAEKNVEIAKYYNDLAEEEITEDVELPQRIENVLYSLIIDYDEDELKVVRKSNTTRQLSTQKAMLLLHKQAIMQCLQIGTRKESRRSDAGLGICYRYKSDRCFC